MSNGFKMHVKGENKFIHVVPNQLVCKDLLDYPEYVARLRTVTKICINNELEGDWCELTNATDRNWLRRLADMNYDVAVIWNDGTWPTATEWEEELEKLLAGEWKDKKWLIAGNIIDHSKTKNRYPYWYHQSILINLKEYKNAGYPNHNNIENKDNKRPGFVRSDENFHDDYTPFWLKADPTVSCKQMHQRYDFLNPMIPNSLNLGYEVLNIPYELRMHQHCCYADQDIEETTTWLMNNDFNKSMPPAQIKKFGYDLDEDKLELFGYKIQQFQVLYITNTENVPRSIIHEPDEKTPSKFKISKMAIPCSGLNQLWHIYWQLDTLKEVIWFDFNPYAIQWTKMMLEEWDGIDFDEFYNSNIERVIGDGVIPRDCVIYEKWLIDRLIENMGGLENFIKVFHRIKELNHTFIELDVVKEYNKLIHAVGNGERVYAQLTNVWQYESNYLNTKPFEAQINFLKLLQSISANNEAFYLTGNTPHGLFYQYTNVKALTGVM